jgi:hypothetical protein
MANAECTFDFAQWPKLLTLSFGEKFSPDTSTHFGLDARTRAETVSLSASGAALATSERKTPPPSLALFPEFCNRASILAESGT